MGTVYLHDWAGSNYSGKTGREALLGDFQITEKALAPYDILLATYSYISYSGDAFVLLQDKQTGELWEVNGSHCSCYGLEGQWKPETTNLEALVKRATEGTLGNPHYGDGGMFKEELMGVLGALVTGRSVEQVAHD